SNVAATATTSPTGAANLTGPDSSGYYTMQLKCVVIPANATMLTGGIGYTYSLGSVNADPTLSFINNNLPFTQVNVSKYAYTSIDSTSSTPNSRRGGTGGLIVPAPYVWRGACGCTGRRTAPGDGP